MTDEHSYSYWLANLIAERDKIWNQIATIEDSEQRQIEFSRYRATSLCMQMIREISAVCEQDGHWHYSH